MEIIKNVNDQQLEIAVVDSQLINYRYSLTCDGSHGQKVQFET